MPCKVLLVLVQHVEHLVDALRVVDVGAGGGFGDAGREGGAGAGVFVGVGGRNGGAGGGVGEGDEVRVAGYEIAGERLGEGGEHGAGGHYFVVDLRRGTS